MIGERIKLLRKESNLLQKELAQKLELSQQTISLYESNRREPDYDTLTKIVDFFDVSTDYLLDRTNTKSPYEIKTIAAHHDGDKFTEEEKKEIENFKEWVLNRRNKPN